MRKIVPTRTRSAAQGFTLIELMVAMTIFLIIGGAAMSLFRQHATLFTTQQGEVGLNMNLRNALQQIQTDAVQAGNGFYNGGATQTSNTPAGVTIQNNAGAFDTVFFIQATTPAVPLSGAGCMLTTSGSATLAAAGSGATASQFSGYVMFIDNNNTKMTVAKLLTSTAGAGNVINLTYNPTAGNGTNSLANDPTQLTNTPTQTPLPAGAQTLFDQFCASSGDLVVGLSWVKYWVNATNQLMRDTSAGNSDVIADNILGFKVGAATYQNGIGYTSTSYYSFNANNANTATPPGYSNQFTLIRSIRVSLIGRTPAGQFTGQNFRNNFDGGQYRIQALSLVVNPRNLSMND